MEWIAELCIPPRVDVYSATSSSSNATSLTNGRGEADLSSIESNDNFQYSTPSNLPNQVESPRLIDQPSNTDKDIFFPHALAHPYNNSSQHDQFVDIQRVFGTQDIAMPHPSHNQQQQQNQSTSRTHTHSHFQNRPTSTGRDFHMSNAQPLAADGAFPPIYNPRRPNRSERVSFKGAFDMLDIVPRQSTWQNDRSVSIALKNWCKKRQMTMNFSHLPFPGSGAKFRSTIFRELPFLTEK